MAGADEIIPMVQFSAISNDEEGEIKQSDVQIDIDHEQQKLQERIQKAIDENTLFPSAEEK